MASSTSPIEPRPTRPRISGVSMTTPSEPLVTAASTGPAAKSGQRS